MDIQNLSKLYREQVRTHVIDLYNNNMTLSLEARGDFINFDRLEINDKYKLIILAMLSDEFDYCEWTTQLDNEEFTLEKLLYLCFFKKTIQLDQVVQQFLDNLIEEKRGLIQETFDEEWDDYYLSFLEMPRDFEDGLFFGESL